MTSIGGSHEGAFEQSPPSRKKIPLQAIGPLEQIKCLLPHPTTLVTRLHRLAPPGRIASALVRARIRESTGKMGIVHEGAIPRADRGARKSRLALSRFSPI